MMRTLATAAIKLPIHIRDEHILSFNRYRLHRSRGAIQNRTYTHFSHRRGNYASYINVSAIFEQMPLDKGQLAPDFQLKDQDGNVHTLNDYRGKKVILYFYPKDDTPGCTKEACGFRDDYSKWKKNDTVILGVSADSEASHKKFAQKYTLPFPLLADTDKKISTAYGVYDKKSLYGRLFWGIKRTTFIIDAQGIIQDVITKVSCDTHSKDLLTAH